MAWRWGQWNKRLSLLPFSHSACSSRERGCESDRKNLLSFLSFLFILPPTAVAVKQIIVLEIISCRRQTRLCVGLTLSWLFLIPMSYCISFLAKRSTNCCALVLAVHQFFTLSLVCHCCFTCLILWIPSGRSRPHFTSWKLSHRDGIIYEHEDGVWPHVWPHFHVNTFKYQWA